MTNSQKYGTAARAPRTTVEHVNSPTDNPAFRTVVTINILSGAVLGIHTERADQHAGSEEPSRASLPGFLEFFLTNLVLDDEQASSTDVQAKRESVPVESPPRPSLAPPVDL